MSKSTSLLVLLLLVSMFAVGPVMVLDNPEEMGAIPDSIPITSAVSANILIDESHTATNTELWTPGNASRFGSMMMQYGHTVVTNFDASLDSGILDSYDILMLFFPQVAFTTAEVEAVHDYVDNGGHLVLVGIDHRPSVSNYNSSPLNAISEPYGITFNQDAWLGRAERSAGELVDHHITYDVDSVLGREGNFLQSCSITVESPAISLCTFKGNDFAAVAEVGDARIVASAGAAPFFLDERDTWLISYDDSHQICLNVIDWLLGEPERKVTLPEEYVITVGTGPDLSESEVENYSMFTGVIHDHTTYSDGRSTAEEMTLAALDAQLDFMVMTDHSWENVAEVGIHGALACEEFVEDNDLDLLIGVGAELSFGPHVLGFPLTENIWSGDMQEKVDGIHAQGGIATLCHPLLGIGYIEPWINYDVYGYDGFEVINTDFFYGEGESAYFRPFYAASDGHDASFVGHTVNTIFVEEPSGPDGTLSVDDIVDALLNRRIVCTSTDLDVVLGEEVWVNRYLEVRDEAEQTIEDAETAINQAITDGATANLANLYLDEAMKALEFQNARSAKELAEMAASEYMLGIDLEVVNDGFGLVDPGTEGTLTITLTNTLETIAILNIIPFLSNAIDLDQETVQLEAAAQDSGSVSITGTASSHGYAHVFLNIIDFNSPDPIDPIILSAGGLIENVTTFVEEVDDGFNGTITVPFVRGDAVYMTSGEIAYNDGTGETTTVMVDDGSSYSITLGPYPTGTNVTYTITISDVFGNEHEFEERILTIESPEVPIDSMVLLIAAGAGIGMIALVVVVLKFRK